MESKNKLSLKEGEVLVRDGKKAWILDIRTKKTVRRFQEDEAIPSLEIRPDPVVAEALKSMERELLWCTELSDPDLYEKILETHSARTHLDYSLEQTPVFPSTAYRRVQILPKGNFQVLLVGDDDLLAVPLALMGHEVTVLEIDPLTIRTIEYFQKKWALEKIRMLSHDLTRPLDDALAGRFDFCFTDPLSTYNCLLVFMSRAVSCLKTGGELFIALSDAGEPIGGHLAELMNLERTAKHRHFSHYYTVHFTVCHYLSHLLRFRKTEKTRPLLPSTEEFSGDLFSFANSFDYHFIQDYYECGIFRQCTADEIIERIHRTVGQDAQCIRTASAPIATAFILWNGRSLRVRLSEEQQWVGVDAVPLERQEALNLERAIHRVLKPARSVSRVSERNPGRT